MAPGVGLREFAFDAVFGETATQAAVYERSAQPLVADGVSGFDGAMRGGGQTGGKTEGTRVAGNPAGAALLAAMG